MAAFIAGNGRREPRLFTHILKARNQVHIISENEAFNKSCPFDPDRLSCSGSRCMAWQPHGRDHGRCAMIPSPSMVPAPSVPPVDADELARVTRERDRLERIVQDFAMEAVRYMHETD